MALLPREGLNGETGLAATLPDLGPFSPDLRRALRQAHYYEQLAALARLAVDLTDPQQLLLRATTLTARAAGCDAALVYLLEPTHLELRVASAFGPEGGPALGDRVANHPSVIAGFVVQQKAALLIPDWSTEGRFTAPQGVISQGLKGGVAVPLFDQGHVVGVLSVGSTRANYFTEDEVRFLQAVASILATSLQRAQIEAQLRQAHKMEGVGNLTGGIAHDFNNLLTVILGNLQMAQDYLEARGDSHGLELLRGAAGAGRRAADLTGKLLAYSRRQLLNPSRVVLSELLPPFVDLLRRTLGEKITVITDVEPGCPACVADRVQLESALLNIAINARDAMPDGGSLRFTCARFNGGADEFPRDFAGVGIAPACWVRISVQDSGVGMSNAVRDRAFEPFFTTKEPGRGTGLGLSSVYGFIRQSKGSIALDSFPGTGTTVSMFLPATDVEAAPVVPTSVAPGPQSLPEGLRVLLVEDDALVRDVTRRYLESLKCTVSAHASAESAWVDIVRGIEISLLITDIELGLGMKGNEFARRAKTLCPELPVLLSSGYSNYLSDERIDDPDRWPLLRKPFSREELSQAIQSALQAAVTPTQLKKSTAKPPA